MSYSVHGIGVDGQYGPQRSKMDERLQQRFGRPEQHIQRQYKGSPIGVAGEDGPERSVMDKKLQAEFGQLNREGFQYRTKYDQNEQKKFNPWYGENREDFRAGQVFEDPYNPYSKYAKYIPLS